MPIPTEPVGSIPRPPELIEGMRAFASGNLSSDRMESLFDAAVRDTIRRFEETGSPVISDGEQRKPSFATYPIHGAKNLAPGGVTIPFEDGHTRQLPVLTGGPFRYATYASSYLEGARKYARVPVKQAVISASALSLLYPQAGIPGYTREAFLDDLVREAQIDIRRSLDSGATVVQIDFTEGRLAVKLDPSTNLLGSFVDLNNRVLAPFTEDERRRLGVHTCPGGDQDSTHSADVDYAELLPYLFRLNVGNFYVQLASEKDRPRVLGILAEHARGDRRIFVGVTDPIDPNVETAEQVRDRVLEAAKFIDPARLGSTDDCGFSPFGDDTSTSRDTAFAKIRSRVAGTEMASRKLGL
ncbi:MAG TPA: cobalamin-independent methionine synthase II family protein [Thermoanaerobaculia bacterium]|jgi:5-methyltetrahydropteroyltriglutamate--homocysteine methyltransferase|nr:cobalamin-independent methionine synthase II family protein [Thermoanaerobaculia bacterium]